MELAVKFGSMEAGRRFGLSGWVLHRCSREGRRNGAGLDALWINPDS